MGPRVWAWRTYRVRKIARDVSRMLVILPFEARFYEEQGVAATYVGNPLADALPAPVEKQGSILALLPGSRLQEIHRIWPPMIAAARLLRSQRPELRLVVPVAPTIDRALFGDPPDVEFTGSATEVLQQAGRAIVASGPATLEAALALPPLGAAYPT